MNLSGLSFKVALKQCNLNVNDVLIAHDDLGNLYTLLILKFNILFDLHNFKNVK